jgi:hypothetical protein
VAQIELFAYPWDIADRGPERFADECAVLGINRIHVTTLYHSGKFLLPRNATRKVYLPEPGRLFVRLPSGSFDGSLAPDYDALADSSWLDRLAKANIPLAAWTVFHHGSSLAGRNPQLTIHNVYGDSYPFALCPSQPAVRAFSRQLARALCATGFYDTLDLETIGYLGYAHGHHHEVAAVPCGTAAQFLLSLCFCDACSEMVSRAGIDLHCLKRLIRELLEARFAADDAISTHPEDSEQIATLLVLFPELQEFIRLRIAVVSTLVNEIRSVASNVDLSVFTSSFVGSPSNIWMEGVSLPGLKQTVDVAHLLAYTADSDRVNNDLAFCKSQIGDPSRLCLTQNLGIPITPTLGHAMQKIDFAWKQGVRRFGFFNYGFLGPGRLAWLREISAELHARETR